MNLQQFFAMSFGLSVEHIYYIAIAVLACVLGAEIAGICMLIGKLRRARSGEIDLPDDEYDHNGRANYAIAALSFGAVSATAELALLVLAIAAAVGAFVLCLLLVVCYAKGYLLISAKAAKEAELKEQAARKVAQEAAAQAARKAAQEAAEQAAKKAAQEAAEALREEEQNEPEYVDEYVDDYDGDEAAKEAISNLIATEDAVMSEEYEEEETVEEAVEEVIEEAAEVIETAVVAQNAEAPAAQTVERTVINEGASAYAGQAPIVEKHIIETTKEIIKETNTTTVTEGKGEQFSPATEEMMKAITEFMKLETQLRMEREVAVERPTEDGESTPTFAEAEDEELEVDEIDVEDEAEAEDEAEREADAEENDDEYESDLFGNERIVGFDEETGCYIIARYRKSCEAKLMQSRPQTKKYYSAIRNALMGYEGTKERMSWSIDTYTNEHTQIAKINVRPRTLDLYLALEPSTLEDSVYRGKDVGGKKKYAETPFLFKVNSPRKLTLALELVQRACEEQGLSPIDIEEVNYEEQYPFTDTETLIIRGLIREYLREEKPAATFELDPDHVPQLAEEDETVIPANANFTWEFDNDQPEVEEAVEEPVIEEVVEEEPEVVVEEPAVEEDPVTVEAPVAPGTTTTTTTTHETIRTTERHYTERYYGNGKEAEVSEETRTIEVLPEPAAEPIEVEAEEIAPEVADEPTEEAIPETGEVVEEITEDVVEENAEPIEEVAEEVIEEEVAEEEAAQEEPAEEVEEVEEIIDDEIEEEIEETTDEQVAQIQSAVAALFGDDVFEEDEPIKEEVAEVVIEDVVEEVEEESAEEESVEEEPLEEIIDEEPEAEAEEEIVEEPVEEEPEAEAEEEHYEEVYEDEPEAEAEEEIYEEVAEEEYYEEVPEAEAEEEYYEEVYEEEPEAEAEEEYYEEDPEAEAEEEYYEEVYEEEPEAEAEEEHYEEESEAEAEEEYYEEEPEGEYYEEVEEVYEDEEFAETYEEEIEEIIEEEVEEEEEEPAPAPKPAPQPASDVVLLDVCLFDDYFDNGAIVNLETLKQVGLAPESATRLKVYASGALKGQFTVEANHFTLDAIKAIGDADGDSIMIR